MLGSLCGCAERVLRSVALRADAVQCDAAATSLQYFRHVAYRELSRRPAQEAFKSLTQKSHTACLQSDCSYCTSDVLCWLCAPSELEAA
jgi:hypothetical protein